MPKQTPDQHEIAEQAVNDAAARYIKAKQDAHAILMPARDGLAEAVRAAYAAGVKKADILRAMNYTWSRQWLDMTLKHGTPPESQD